MNVVQKTPGVQDAGNPLQTLEKFGQSPWLDFIQRSFVEDGSLAGLVRDDHLKGVTSNPAIFEKAMGHGTDYDPQFKAIVEAGNTDVSEIYETMAIDDIRAATDVLKPVWDATQGLDGYVSLEVSPYLGLRTEPTIIEARRLWKAVGKPNLMVKIPGTEAGVPAIRQVISEGININVTLLFSLDAYKKVLEAYISGLEERHGKGEDISHIASVASFFVSRIDGLIDKAIDKRVADGDKESEALKALRGKVAIANAKMAYQHYLEISDSERWKALKAVGANPQRLLWASTGVKDKAYSDVLYVEELIGADTVNTMPPATMDAFRDHGTVRNALTENVEAARHVLAETERLGLDLTGVTDKLVKDGVDAFADSFDALLGAVAAKKAELAGDTVAKSSLKLPKDLDDAVKASLETWRKDGTVRQLWERDASVWTGKDEAKWLRWLDIVSERIEGLPELEAFQQAVHEKGVSHVLLLGMGGSSLGPEVLAETFGQRAGYPELHVLDSTDPQQVTAFEAKVDLAKTLVIVSSKSGGTLEPNILKAYFFDKMTKAVGDKAGEHFVAVTDPGSHMEEVATGDSFWRIFHGDKEIGGRYSVLSNFGLVPAAAIGLDLPEFLSNAERMVKACSAGTPPVQNPGVLLGTVLGVGAKLGRDKVTIVASPGISDLGAWLEQLLAESTGKDGHGIVPIEGETLGAPDVYGHDRVFAYVRLTDSPDAKQDAAVKALEAAGQPVVTISLSSKMQIAQEFFRWEFATAVAGSIIGIDAFNQPDVEASKIETKKLTDAYSKSGSLPAETPFGSDGDFSFFADDANAAALKEGVTLDGVLKAHFARVKEGDYVALLAYIERKAKTIEWIQTARLAVRDAKHVATAAEFGPRFLHSTGQAYKGGPNSGVFLQITSDDQADVAVPGETFSFGVVKAAQARGDFDVLAERGRRALRVHVKGNLSSALDRLGSAIKTAVG